jgi:hypothetical protein
MFLAVLLKWLLVLGCLAAGLGLLLTGLGAEIPLIRYQGLEAHGMPAGIAALIAGVALAKFWRIENESTQITQTTGPDGTMQFVKHTKRMRRLMLKPRR